jgi:hypothetical protein
MARELLAAHQAGRVEVAIGRASDYYGPRGGAQSNLGDRVFPAALAGKTATVLGDPPTPRAPVNSSDLQPSLRLVRSSWTTPATPAGPPLIGATSRESHRDPSPPSAPRSPST